MDKTTKRLALVTAMASLATALTVGLSAAGASVPGTTFCNGLPVTISGTPHADHINATLPVRVDVVDSKAGKDSVDIDSGDTACLGNGDDEADIDQYGPAGTAEVFGDAGDDHITGGGDPDLLRDPAIAHGGGGDDFIQYVWGTLHGGPGRDEIIGSDLDDELHGNDAGDLLIGDYTWYTGDHTSNTGGRDNLQGGAGDDQLYGGGGNDTLEGDNGHDTADGGPGIDICHAEVETNCELN